MSTRQEHPSQGYLFPHEGYLFPCEGYLFPYRGVCSLVRGICLGEYRSLFKIRIKKSNAIFVYFRG